MDVQFDFSDEELCAALDRYFEPYRQEFLDAANKLDEAIMQMVSTPYWVE